jgi:hypothetical protein
MGGLAKEKAAGGPLNQAQRHKRENAKRRIVRQARFLAFMLEPFGSLRAEQIRMQRSFFSLAQKARQVPELPPAKRMTRAVEKIDLRSCRGDHSIRGWTDCPRSI